ALSGRAAHGGGPPHTTGPGREERQPAIRGVLRTGAPRSSGLHVLRPGRRVSVAGAGGSAARDRRTLRLRARRSRPRAPGPVPGLPARATQRTNEASSMTAVQGTPRAPAAAQAQPPDALAWLDPPSSTPASRAPPSAPEITIVNGASDLSALM